MQKKKRLPKEMTPFERMADLARRIVNVPKSEVPKPVKKKRRPRES